MATGSPAFHSPAKLAIDCTRSCPGVPSDEQSKRASSISSPEVNAPAVGALNWLSKVLATRITRPDCGIGFPPASFNTPAPRLKVTEAWTFAWAKRTTPSSAAICLRILFINRFCRY